MIELTITELGAGGDGVGRDDNGRVTFVPYAAVGDRLEVTIERQTKSFARASISRIIEPGPGRRKAPCEHFGVCGGCQWLHLENDAQKEAKTALVHAQLRHWITDDVVVHPLIVPTDTGLGWRRRARFTWYRPRRADSAIVGFFQAQSKRITAIDGCVQLSEALQKVHRLIVDHLAPKLTGKGTIVALAGQQGVLLGIEGPCDPSAAEAFIAHEGVAGVRLGTRYFGRRTVALEGGIEVQAGHFAQASAAGNDRLRQVVSEWVGREPSAGRLRIAEFFAGAGNLTSVLAEHAADIVAVDTVAADPVAPNVRFVQGSAVDIARIVRRKEEPFDVVVLDPPRTGAKELMPWLRKMAPPTIVYVSCDAATLARDLALLEPTHRLVEVQALDMMPQTAHLETVVRLVARE